MGQALERLLEALWKEKGGESWDEFAEGLGVTSQALYYMRTGGRKPGKEMLSKMLRSYPQLTRFVLDYLHEDGDAEPDA
jgi:hypothetical protein